MQEDVLFHGASGDAILGIIDAGAMHPGADRKIYFSKWGWEHVLMHGADRRRAAAFVIKLKVQIPLGAQTYRTATPGVPDTFVIETTEPVRAEVLELVARHPSGDRGFRIRTIRGLDEIRDYLHIA